MDTKGILERKTSDVAPLLAVGFKSEKSNGKYRYLWLLKGRFEQPSVTRRTKEGTVNFQTAVIRGKFLRRDYDELWIREADEDETGYVETVGTGWFTEYLLVC